MVICPECNSKRVFIFRLDSDWGEGMGDYYTINDEECYPKEEYQLDSYDRPDIHVCHCRECGHIW